MLFDMVRVSYFHGFRTVTRRICFAPLIYIIPQKHQFVNSTLVLYP